MKRGYIAIWRKIMEHPFAKERRVFSKYEAWLDILMNVQHSEKKSEVVIGMSVLECNYSESLRSIKTWSRSWGWSESRVRRFFKLLENMKQIQTKSEGQTTRLKVLNYSQYDPKRRANEFKTNLDRICTDEGSTTDKNVNNEKNVNNKNPPTPLGEKKVSNKSKLSQYKIILAEKIKESGLDVHHEKLVEFLEYRMDMPASKKYKSEKGISGLIKDVSECAGAGLDISDCLETAMQREWLSPQAKYFKNNGANQAGRFSNGTVMGSKRMDSNLEACKQFLEND